MDVRIIPLLCFGLLSCCSSGSQSPLLPDVTAAPTTYRELTPENSPSDFQQGDSQQGGFIEYPDNLATASFSGEEMPCDTVQPLPAVTSSTLPAPSRPVTPASTAQNYVTPIASAPPAYYSSYSRYYDPSYRPYVGTHYVAPSVRRDGTYVQGHYKTNSDDSFYNNMSTVGNYNPYTGKIGTKKAPYSTRSRFR